MLIWVTGSTSKIGSEISNYIEDNGHTVIRSSTKQCDLRDFESTSKFVENIYPDAVICCAGGNKVNKKRPKGDDCIHMSPSDISEIFNKNMLSIINTCKAVIPKINNGHIIFIGSNIVGCPRKNGEVAMYAMAKAAIHEYAVHLARAFPNIKTNCLAPDGTSDPKDVAIAVSNILKTNITGQIIKMNDGKSWVN